MRYETYCEDLFLGQPFDKTNVHTGGTGSQKICFGVRKLFLGEEQLDMASRHDVEFSFLAGFADDSEELGNVVLLQAHFPQSFVSAIEVLSISKAFVNDRSQMSAITSYDPERGKLGHGAIICTIVCSPVAPEPTHAY